MQSKLMKNSLLKSLRQLSGKHYLLTLVSGVVWILFSWLVADQVLLMQMKNLLREESSGLSKHIDNDAEVIKQHFQKFHGISKLVAQDESVINALLHNNLRMASAASTVEQRKSLWESNAKLSAINKHLAQVASALGAQVVYVMNADGFCVASSNADNADSFVGANYAQREHFIMSRNTGTGHQYAVGAVSGIPGFYFRRCK